MPYTLEVTPRVPTSSQLMIEFDRALTAFDAHTPLQFFRWDQRATPPTTYDYRIRASDGRDWIQVYDYIDPAVLPAERPSAKTSGDAWSVREINLHRAVRGVLLRIVASYGVTTLRATFA